jgi:cytochrome c556
MNCNNTPAIASIVLIACMAMVTTVLAHEGATGIVKERMDSMKVMGDASKAIVDMIRGKTTYSDEAVAEYAATINQHSKYITDHYPPGSLQDVSEALPVIWERWDEFEKLAQQLESSSAALIETAQNSDQKAVRAQFAKVAKSCKGCHEDYRQKQD